LHPLKSSGFSRRTFSPTDVRPHRGAILLRMSGYWKVVEPFWYLINIYYGPEVFRSKYDSAPKISGLIFAAHFCQSEVCNGGFGQFFSNSTGVLAPEAVEGFRQIGQPQVAAVVESAMELLGPAVETTQSGSPFEPRVCWRRSAARPFDLRPVLRLPSYTISRTVKKPRDNNGKSNQCSSAASCGAARSAVASR
jgi:hypothetical protein